MRRPTIAAAVDLGSNSFHMIVARVASGRLRVLDRLRERVALAEGLDARKRLAATAQRRALDCLERFGQRLRDMPARSVRAVGTNTLRQAKNGREFLQRARRALGHPIEVVSGREEARLIYQGVAHSVGANGGRRLVVDIGGGSTECVVGEGFDVVRADSLYMGCVGWSRRHFPDGHLSARALERARIAALVELEPIERAYRRLGWSLCLGSSGTILAVEQVLRLQGWSDGTITPKGLAAFRTAIAQAGHPSRLRLRGLEAERVPIIAGGVAILSAVVDALAIQQMQPSWGALREGVLFDLLGRFSHEDVRDRTIDEMAERYHLDREHARRVGRTALRLLQAAQERWQLDPDASRQMLSWAARLHEIGLSVAYSGHQKHGAYIVANADMPGFSREDQLVLSAVIGGHRRKLPSAAFDALPATRGVPAERLCVLLRLAALLRRSRSRSPVTTPSLRVKQGRIRLAFPPGWLAQNPLTAADLADEAARLSAAGYRLDVS